MVNVSTILKYKAHDENNVAKGDIVRIMETRPLSATKRFRLVELWKSCYYLIKLKGEN